MEQERSVQQQREEGAGETLHKFSIEEEVSNSADQLASAEQANEEVSSLYAIPLAFYCACSSQCHTSRLIMRQLTPNFEL